MYNGSDYLFEVIEMEELEKLKTGFEKDDLFQRKAIVENLMKVVNTSTQCRVIAIDSEWGSGKTTFLKNWQNHIEKTEDNTKCIFFDAWENDFYADPIVPLIGILEEVLKLNEVGFEDLRKAFRSITFEVIKSFTLSTLDLSKVNSDLTDVSRTDMLTYKSLKTEKDIIINRLGELAGDKKVYFFIDELDRCKPTFAISLLERIKHYFRISNFVFVFGVDLKQLGLSVQSIYGQIDVTSYFKKFFDISLVLPKPEHAKYFVFFADELKNDYLVSSYLLNNIARMIESNRNVTLREVDQIIDIIKVSYPLSSNFREQLEMMPFLIMFKVKEPDLYRSYLKNEFQINDDVIEKYNIKEVYGKRSDDVIEKINILSIHNYNLRNKKAGELNRYIEADNSLADFANIALEFKNDDTSNSQSK
jgi:hypothetical protein